MKKIRIILADDHVVVRQGLRSLIDQEKDLIVVGEADDGLQLLVSVEKLRPDVVLVDLKMPNLNGIAAAAEIKKRFQNTHTVVLTMHADCSYIESAFQAGVCGYVLKDDDIYEMCTAIRYAAHGERYLSTEVSKQIEGFIKSGNSRPTTIPQLTLREQQVLQLVSEGKTNNEIASILGISVRTVEGHRAHVMSKLNLKTPIDIILYALKHNILVEQ